MNKILDIPIKETGIEFTGGNPNKRLRRNQISVQALANPNPDTRNLKPETKKCKLINEVCRGFFHKFRCSLPANPTHFFCPSSDRLVFYLIFKETLSKNPQISGQLSSIH